MQIERDQSVCPACGAGGLEIFPVLHHMICAYVGPQYDFASSSRWIYLSEMPARRCVGRPRLRDRWDKRALCAMWQGDGGVAAPSADPPGKQELMSAGVKSTEVEVRCGRPHSRSSYFA